MVLLAGILTACNDEDELRLSPIQETTMEGSASTLQIEMTRGDWRIASITTLYGVAMVDSDNRPLQLEGTGSLHFRWFDLTRKDETLITIEAKDNFDDEERGFIINLETKTGFYKEQVIVRQAVCTDFYQVKSITYSIGEGDGVEEAESREWGISVYDYTNKEGGSWTTHFRPFYNAYVIYSFEHSGNDYPYKYTGIGNDIYVDIPKGIEEDGSISYESGKMPYGMWKTYDSELKETDFSVEQM